jgi:hypothetical protein
VQVPFQAMKPDATHRFNYNDVFVAQLDEFTYEEVKSGGRFYVVPKVHSIKRTILEPEEAIEFAIERGYLGVGFSTELDAATFGQWRKEGIHNTGRRFPDWVTKALMPHDYETYYGGDSMGGSIPFNPAGRGRAGFKNPFLDDLLARGDWREFIKKDQTQFREEDRIDTTAEIFGQALSPAKIRSDEKTREGVDANPLIGGN